MKIRSIHRHTLVLGLGLLALSLYLPATVTASGEIYTGWNLLKVVSPGFLLASMVPLLLFFGVLPAVLASASTLFFGLFSVVALAVGYCSLSLGLLKKIYWLHLVSSLAGLLFLACSSGAFSLPSGHPSFGCLLYFPAVFLLYRALASSAEDLQLRSLRVNRISARHWLSLWLVIAGGLGVFYLHETHHLFVSQKKLQEIFRHKLENSHREPFTDQDASKLIRAGLDASAISAVISRCQWPRENFLPILSLLFDQYPQTLKDTNLHRQVMRTCPQAYTELLRKKLSK